MEKEVRVRFAPSPTGFLHVGGARTALYNWLFARHEGGKFLLRIEDTDRERSTPEMVDYIVEGLSWLGLDWDEEPIFQSHRLDVYKKYAEDLVKRGLAYYARTVDEEQAGERTRREWVEAAPEEIGKVPLAVRFRVPVEGETSYEDLIRGLITFKNSEIGDFTILRSDGTPTYQLACVLDDHFMGITHVIRGEDHIPNTPKQILLYRAFGWDTPLFAHLPMILGPDKKKLSKRHGATAVLEYRDMGILPEALFNFLALLGWSPGEDREIGPKDEMIRLFDIRRVGKRAAVFDINKLLWMNSVYIRMKTDEELLRLVLPLFEERRLVKDDSDREKLLRVIPLLKERARVLPDFVEMGFYFFSDEFEYEEKGVRKYLQDPEVPGRLRLLRERLADIPEGEFRQEKIEETLRGLAGKLGIKAALLIHPTRLLLTGRTQGPGLFELMEVLGRDECLRRLDNYLKRVS
ncbi:MAG: glutamate--tRNA ligase [Candidatus Hydrothermota bacterium]|nr:MAG: glutamate--tRNA ligase [Candidatus Hydrothermae bacterium]